MTTVGIIIGLCAIVTIAALLLFEPELKAALRELLPTLEPEGERLVHVTFELGENVVSLVRHRRAECIPLFPVDRITETTFASRRESLEQTIITLMHDLESEPG